MPGYVGVPREAGESRTDPRRAVSAGAICPTDAWNAMSIRDEEIAPDVQEMVLCNMFWHASRPWKFTSVSAPQQGVVAGLGRFYPVLSRIFLHELCHVMSASTNCESFRACTN